MSKDENKNDDDQAFLEAMSDVVPLEQNRAQPYKQKPAPRPLNLDAGTEGDELADTWVEAPEFFDFMRPGVQRRLYSDLKRGILPPEDTLDLHGMRVIDAKQAFQRFIKQSTGRGRRCVKIIHGKGHGSDHKPVLKEKTYQWLIQLKEVLAFCTAPRWDGGSGATYILLSRKYRKNPG